MAWKPRQPTAEHASLNIIDRFNSLIACKELCDWEICETNWNVMISLNETEHDDDWIRYRNVKHGA